MIRTILTAVVVCAAIVSAQTANAQQAQQNQKPAKPTTVVVPAPTPTTPLNLNTATSAEFEKLPGVGPAMAQRILDYRQKNNGFKKIEDLMNIKGIGEKIFLKLKPLIVVAPARADVR